MEIVGLWNVYLRSKIWYIHVLQVIYLLDPQAHPSPIPASRRTTIPASSFDAMLTKLISVIFTRSAITLLVKCYNHQSLRISFSAQIDHKRFVNAVLEGRRQLPCRSGLDSRAISTGRCLSLRVTRLYRKNEYPKEIGTQKNSPSGPTALCLFRKPISLMVSVPDGGRVSNCTISFAGTSERSTAAIGQLNYALKCSFRRSRVWISEPPDLLVIALSLGSREPIFLISQ